MKKEAELKAMRNKISPAKAKKVLIIYTLSILK